MIDVDHQPGAAYFERMAAHARTHWWYEGRRLLVRQALDGRLAPGATVVDVGCGTGDNLAALAEVAGGVRVAVAAAEHLPYPDGAADLLASMDVIEHLDDDAVALAEYRRVLRPGGVLLLTVPAYPWLWSAHDETAAHRRRYTRRQLESVVREAGFAIERSTFYNSFLVPPAAAIRRTPLRRLAGEHDEEVGESRPLVGRLLTAISRAERRVLARRRMPFGLSILVVAARPPGT